MVEARLRVIYGDTDQMGVVYYANYFRYFEFARSEYFRARGGSYREMESSGLMLPVAEASCAYKSPARYDDVLIIRAMVSELRRASVVFTYELFREGEPRTLLCTGRTLHACVGRDGKPTRLPESVARLLEHPNAGT
ncbi:acyl-CoA thioesterase [Myxococcus sp. CA051A]|uniref:Acyl-CoA thioesterase n=1 Tax=Myxococcus llanfairpwllgwyngyllgogerychwyrndrobwllllantysiliogogogochensis TaxID=2590453 RepID=A0A540WU42_9BACT|nr:MULTISPECIES: thioesterase family protein [Myxococcus]NTX01898.1 acyl-CoA thioesterase [Myxococcus sp. CA040A]NTX14614.1 acyl-CoA thioesterase [Myxococcus sp. CA056]NTX38726.1 acyl-CoA thioesterase [Myxococcus sp. CA033]NTX54128.1 acyl-CoA thioesterase [Myxococcus sp. CA039A]NTX62709.1 acyl-CoA thioesterase [Myxococcus sp. CA051A]